MLRVFLCSVLLGFIGTTGAGTAHAQPDNPRMMVTWPTAHPQDLGTFSRAAEPFKPINVRPEIEKLDDRRVLRVLNKARREIRNRVMMDRLRARFPAPVVKRLAESYRLMPAQDLDGLSIIDNKDLEAVYLETRSVAFSRSLVTSSCELEAIYDNDPTSGNPPMPFVPSSETQIRQSAKAVVAIVDKSVLEEQVDGSYELWSQTFTVLDGFMLCDFSAIYGLPTTAIYGTGFLVENDLIVTAAHVAQNLNFLERARFVFDYTLPAEGATKTVFAADQVYKAVSESVLVKDEDGRDFAVVKLEKAPPSSKYPSLTLRSDGRIADHEMVYAIGHPLGLPQMYTGPKELYENGPCAYFMSTLDTYDYQSGSPVINAATGVVEGILTDGNKEYRSYCDCDAPAAATSEDGLSTAYANRAKLVADAIARPEEIIIRNESDAMVLVRTNDDYSVDGSQTRTIPLTAEMMMMQLPEIDSDTGEILYRCTIQYSPLPGETWKIIQGDQTGSLIMARCVEETLSGIE